MFLFLFQDFPQMFGDGVFPERFGLPNALTIVAYRGVFVVEISASKRVPRVANLRPEFCCQDRQLWSRFSSPC